MRKLFDGAELLLLIVFSLFYYTTFNIGKLYFSEPWGTIISMVIGTGAYYLFAKYVRKEFLQHRTACVVLILGLFACVEGCSRWWLQASIFDSTLTDLFIWGIIPMLVVYLGHKYLLEYRRHQVRKLHGDGSEGLQVKAKPAAAGAAQLAGKNKPLTGAYDAKCAVKCLTGTYVGKLEKHVLSFKGIPYAQQPVGALRWQAPQPLPASDAVSEAYYYGPQEPQPRNELFETTLYRQSEGCLHLNIWQNTHYKGTKPRRVLVYFPYYDNVIGGTASTSSEGDSLVREHPEILYVDVDYRLGWFGNLQLNYLPGGEQFPDSANVSLLDQAAALKWLQENVAAFGGDPEQITVLGSSPVLLLPLLPQAQGLFTKLICYDGSIGETISEATAKRQLEDICAYLGVHTAQDFLKLSSEALVRGMEELYGKAMALPVRDGRLVPEDILAAYAQGAAKNIELVLGSSLDCARFFLAGFGDKYSQYLAELCQAYLPQATVDQQPLLDELVARYSKDKNSTLERNITLYTFLTYHLNNFELCKRQVAAGGQAYAFLWAVASAIEHFGAYAGASFAYFLGKTEDLAQYGFVSDKLVGKVWSQLLVNFITKGKPNLEPGEINNVNPIVWQPFTVAKPQLLVLTEKKFALDLGEFVEQMRKLEPFVGYLRKF